MNVMSGLRMKHHLALAVAIVGFTAHAGTVPPVELAISEASAQTRMLKAENCGRFESDFRACIAPVLSDLDADQAKIARHLKVAKHKDLLKDYVLASRIALKGAEPLAGERTVDYRRRFGDLQTRAAESWERFAMEVE